MRVGWLIYFGGFMLVGVGSKKRSLKYNNIEWLCKRWIYIYREFI